MVRKKHAVNNVIWDLYIFPKIVPKMLEMQFQKPLIRNISGGHALDPLEICHHFSVTPFFR